MRLTLGWRTFSSAGMRSSWLFGFSCLFLACGGAPSGGDGVPASAPSDAPPAGSAGGPAASSAPEAADASPTGASATYVPPPAFPAPSPAPTPLAASVRDPKIVKLAKTAAACKFEEGDIDRECKAFNAWTDEEKLFEGKGNLTLLSLLEDADPKLRQVASAHRFDKPDAFFADKENARRLIAIAAKETDAVIAHTLGERVTAVDAEKLGLQSEFFALTKHADKSFRDALAFYLLGRNPSAFNLVVAERLMNDAEVRVQETAAGSLSTGGITKGTDGVCKLLAKEITRTDSPGAKALWAAGTSNCGSVFPALVSELEKRTRAMKDAKYGIEYGLAASAACNPRPTFDEPTLTAMKKRLFVVGKALLESKDANLKTSGISVIAGCDPVAARPLLEPLLKDKDTYVVDRVKDALKMH